MKNSFKKRAGRAALAGATLLGLTAAGLAAAAPANAATPADAVAEASNLIKGTLGTDYYWFKADGTVARHNNTNPLLGAAWTYPTFGGVGQISRDGMCIAGSVNDSSYNTVVACDDTALNQVWYGNKRYDTLVLANKTSTGRELFAGLAASSQTRANGSGSYFTWGLATATPVAVAPTLSSPLPGATITPETVFSGAGSVNTVITVTDKDGETVGTATVGADGKWSLTLDPAPMNGVQGLKVVALDTEGKSTTLADGDYTMTLSDEARALTSPEADTVITPETAFAGTGHIGDTVKIKDADGNVVGETTVGSDGTWSTTLDGLVGNGSKNLVVEVSGKDGLTEQLADNSYTAEGFDEPRAITSPQPGAVITPETVFTGTGNIGDTIVIKDKDGNVLGEATVGNDGTWSAPITSLPGNGDTNLVIEVTGKNGETETLAENTYVAEGVDLDRAVTSPGAGDAITPDTVFTGTGNIGDTVKIKDKDGNVLGETVVGNDGKWSTTLDPAPSNGDTNLVIEVTGKNGETEIIADDTYTMDGSEEPRTISSPLPGAVVTPDTAFTGTGAKGDTITITGKDGKVLGTATVGDDGKWSTTLDGLTGNGATDLKVTITGKDGSTNTLAEGTYTVEGVDEPRALTSPESGSSITPDTEFSGTGNMGDTVKIKDKDGNVLGTAEVGNDGKWSTKLSPAPSNGDTSLIIEVTGKDGKTEQLADNTYEMTESTNKFEVLTPDLSQDSGNIKNGTVFTGKGQPDTTIVITDQDGNVVGEATVDGNGNWSTPVTGLPQGPNNLTITHTAPGAEPVSTDLGKIVVVSEDEATPLMDPAIAGGFGLSLLAAAGAFLGFRRRRTAAQQ